ncbi:hypothetical protein BD310DRAFT_586214 [Dichomitus squalens]|uniref:Uncharacterized protein n=1 Tax=Dichomitus squalens TaxID=114155 RepID=A0A4Q9Q926_9APHY|nr:hypothetical protein BD310DRAFT_586214 [Dichomitus squalens]
MHTYTGRGVNCGRATGLLQEDCPSFHTAELDTGRKWSKSMFHVLEESHHSTNKIVIRIQNFAIWRPSLSHCHPVETRGLLSAVSAITLSSMSAILSMIDLPHLTSATTSRTPTVGLDPDSQWGKHPFERSPCSCSTLHISSMSHAAATFAVPLQPQDDKGILVPSS